MCIPISGRNFCVPALAAKPVAIPTEKPTKHIVNSLASISNDFETISNPITRHRENVFAQKKLRKIKKKYPEKVEERRNGDSKKGKRIDTLQYVLDDKN